MTYRTGKISFSTIIFFLAILYGGFVAYKFINVRLGNGEIKNEVVNKIGSTRGPDFIIDDGVKIIKDILIEKKIVASENEIQVLGDDTEDSSNDSASENSNTPKNPPNATIALKFNDGRSKLTLFIKYNVLLDCILFKTKQELTIEDEILNYN